MISSVSLMGCMGHFFVLHIFKGVYKEHQSVRFIETTRHLF